MADPVLQPPFRWEGGHIAADLPGARGLFTTRRGGVSAGPYASLNLGLWTDDDPDATAENRARVAAAAGVAPDRVLHGRQVHGATVRRATGPTGEPREEDGQATALADAAALVVGADCLPVLLVSDGAVAALHCGWGGLARGILAEGVTALRELGAGGPVAAAIGPGARGCCYEVGEERHAVFAGVPGARAGERNLDLPAVARYRLAESGAGEIHDTGLCTICAGEELFFSHRRDAGVTGRQAGVAWRM